ncbi:MAG: YbaK/EbsC family protein [Phycicoccus sp.]
MDADAASATPDLTAHPAVAAVLAALAVHHVRPQVVQLPGAVRTAAQAAAALHVTPAEIANSLVFAATTREGTVQPLLILASGAHRVDPEQVADLEALAALDRADPSFVREHTRMAIGGVAPVGHPRPIRTIVDVSLGRYDRVWAAAGHSHTVFATTYDELIRVTGGHPMDVA